MARPRSGPTLTPSFREFMPRWLARQRWYLGVEVPVLRPVDAFGLEDPDGGVGIETQLVTDGDEICQIPVTYRGAALAKGALIAAAEHSVPGIRWIYDATTDPVWEADAWPWCASDQPELIFHIRAARRAAATPGR